MKRLRLRGRWLWLGLPMVPVLSWAVVLALVPTEWARTRMADRLASATGRSVRIGALRLGVLGNLRILDVSLAERSTPADPWVRVAEARVDIHLGQVLLGRCDPGEIVVQGASVRFWRRKDGTPEIGDFLRAAPPDPGGRASHAAKAPLRLKVQGASIRVVDDPSGTRFDLTGVQGEATSDGRLTTLSGMRGTLNGGTFEMAAKLDRDPARPGFEVEVRANGVGIETGMPALAYLVPVVAGTTNGAGARRCRPRDGESGGDLLSQALSDQVPSALRGLTSLFGKGRGGSPSP